MILYMSNNLDTLNDYNPRQSVGKVWIFTLPQLFNLYGVMV